VGCRWNLLEERAQKEHVFLFQVLLKFRSMGREGPSEFHLIMNEWGGAGAVPAR
jgi:hypothetical protein